MSCGTGIYIFKKWPEMKKENKKKLYGVMGGSSRLYSSSSFMTLFGDLNSEVACLTAGNNISPTGDDPIVQNGKRRKSSSKF